MKHIYRAIRGQLSLTLPLSMAVLLLTQTVSAKEQVVIESQVTGTQEQPKVLYIMPWQGITNPIKIDGKTMQITLPKLNPINPKVFQQEVREFSVNLQKSENKNQ